jgi:hypothetical protein
LGLSPAHWGWPASGCVRARCAHCAARRAPQAASRRTVMERFPSIPPPKQLMTLSMSEPAVVVRAGGYFFGAAVSGAFRRPWTP